VGLLKCVGGLPKAVADVLEPRGESYRCLFQWFTRDESDTEGEQMLSWLSSCLAINLTSIRVRSGALWLAS
jgi:hypothetical protein